MSDSEKEKKGFQWSISSRLIRTNLISFQASRTSFVSAKDKVPFLYRDSCLYKHKKADDSRNDRHNHNL